MSPKTAVSTDGERAAKKCKATPDTPRQGGGSCSSGQVDHVATTARIAPTKNGVQMQPSHVVPALARRRSVLPVPAPLSPAPLPPTPMPPTPPTPTPTPPTPVLPLCFSLRDALSPVYVGGPDRGWSGVRPGVDWSPWTALATVEYVRAVGAQRAQRRRRWEAAAIAAATAGSPTLDAAASSNEKASARARVRARALLAEGPELALPLPGDEEMVRVRARVV